MDSEEDAYYTSSEDMSDGAAEYSGGGYDDAAAEKPYTILKDKALKRLMQNDISEVSNLLAVTRGVACTLLLRQNWSVEHVLDEWFADEDRVRKSVGISTDEKRRKLESNSYYCKICLETVELSRTLPAACGHLFCSDCWARCVAAAVRDGAGCLRLRCPEPNCAARAGLDVVEAAAAEEDKRRFHQYLYRSYVESSRRRKCCLGPGCEFAVEFNGGGGEETYDVTCGCGFKFCWRCREEQHRPVGCETAAKWAEKNSSDSEAKSDSWIAAYTKPCPKCTQNIEKNQGCSYMTCRCGHEFCWDCMQKQDCFCHVCNKYLREKEAAIESSMIRAREELTRYAFYYERWVSCHKLWEIGRAGLARARSELLPELSAALDLPETVLEFVVEAREQIVECWRVLKWSSAYGYYSRVDERNEEFFEFLLDEAVRSVVRLHHCAKKATAGFVGPHGGALEEFGDFGVKLRNLTRVTKRSFENLVRALENDLSEVGVA